VLLRHSPLIGQQIRGKKKPQEKNSQSKRKLENLVHRGRGKDTDHNPSAKGGRAWWGGGQRGGHHQIRPNRNHIVKRPIGIGGGKKRSPM